MFSALSPSVEPLATETLDPSTHRWWQDCLLLSLAFLIFFGAFLGSRPLTVPDEGRYAEIPREMLTSGDYITPRVNGVKYFEKPPLFYWMQTVSMRSLGFNEWAVRLPNALMGLLGVLLAYATGRRLYNRRTGLLAGMALGTFGLYSAMAHMVTLDMTVTLFLSAAMSCFILGNQYPAGQIRNRFMWGMYFCAALATMTKGMMGFALPCLIIFIWILLTRQWSEIKTYCLPTGLLLFSAIVVPWHVLVQLKNTEFFKYYIVDQHILRYLTETEKRNQPLWFLPGILLAGLFPWTGFIIPAIAHSWPFSGLRKQRRGSLSVHETEPTTTRSMMRKLIRLTGYTGLNPSSKPREQSSQRYQEDKIAVFLLLWAGCIFLFFWLGKSQLTPYVLPIYPPLAIIFGRYLDGVLRSTPSHWGIRFGLIVSSLISLTALVIGLFTLDLSQRAMDVTLALLAVSTVVPLVFYRRGYLANSLISLSVISGLFLMSIIFSYPPTDTRSVKSLATVLKPLVKEGDTVYSYYNHFQDLPFYLGRRVVMVQYYGELWHGLGHGDREGLWVSIEEFWPRWSKPSRQFMIMSLGEYHAALDQHAGPLYEIARTARNILVSNFPTTQENQ